MFSLQCIWIQLHLAEFIFCFLPSVSLPDQQLDEIFYLSDMSQPDKLIESYSFLHSAKHLYMFTHNQSR